MTLVTVDRGDASEKTIDALLEEQPSHQVVRVIYPDQDALFRLSYTGSERQGYLEQERWRFTHPNLGEKLTWFEEWFPEHLVEKEVDEEVAAHAGIIAAERLRNAYEHGVFYEPDGVIGVTLWIRPDGVDVGIADNGPGFDIERNLRPLNRGEMRKRGHGLNIVRGLANSAYSHNEGRDLVYSVRTSPLPSSPDA